MWRPYQGVRLSRATARILFAASAVRPSSVIAARAALSCMPASQDPAATHALYQAAIARLNSLQSNAVTLQKLREKRDLFQEANVPETIELLRQCGIEMKDINGLNVIHVSGTKGKGSTCAFIEVMLRTLGYKTGFYSSPHLVHARERIRINGIPISEDAFSFHFFRVFDRLTRACQENDQLTMPAYFKFLTVMAFDVFVKEKVDVAIVEVGIGGQYDATNAVQSPKVCAVSTLDYDHTSLLGSTLKEIAWHKAGIFKKGSQALVADVTTETFEVMTQRARELQVSNLSVVPPLSCYPFERSDVRIGIPGVHQKNNISLALQAVRSWLRACARDESIFSGGEWSPGQPFRVPSLLQDALEHCRWPGRSQTIRTALADFYLDGAHTPKSIEVCASWFSSCARASTPDRRRVLLFHCTADRTPETLLPMLKEIGFHYALFCPTIVSTVQDSKSDLTNYNQNVTVQCQRSIDASITWSHIDPSTERHTFPCIASSLEWIRELGKEVPLDVLVTGSLHLVGGVISLVDPQSAM